MNKNYIAFDSVQGTLHTNESTTGFESVGFLVGNMLGAFPAFSGTRIMMMPFYAQDLSSLPASLDAYKPLLARMIAAAPKHVEFPEGSTAYLTIDEMRLEPGRQQRKSGLHVDGMYQGQLAGAWGGGGGGWGSCGNGMLLSSNTDDLCRMWVGSFEGVPVGDGDCEHLRDQLGSKQEHVFHAGEVFWADGLCVHESFAAKRACDRQFVRISLPNNAPWFEGYTVNPLGILPSGCILSERRI